MNRPSSGVFSASTRAIGSVLFDARQTLQPMTKKDILTPILVLASQQAPTANFGLPRDVLERLPH